MDAGESVWCGWFLLMICELLHLAESRGEVERTRAFRERAERLHKALEEHAWDGQWYRRAYFDDGTPLGSSQNEECKIDSVAQTWAVISGAAEPRRARQAWQAAEDFLVRRGDGVILLFTPPFDRSPLEPGYVKGYLPGIRENGGQYTAAAWCVSPPPARQGKPRGGLFDLLNYPPYCVARGRFRYRVGAVHYGGRRLQRTSHRPWRLDLVHRLRRLALSRCPGNNPRLSASREYSVAESLHTERLDRVRHHLPISHGELPYPRG